MIVNVIALILSSCMLPGVHSYTPLCVCLEQFGEGTLKNPTFFKTAPGDDDRIFISEQPGLIWIYDRQGNRKAEPFVDFGHRFHLSSYDERGVLGMAFHPEFQRNNRVFIYYGTVTGSPLTRVAEFVVEKDDPDKADMSSERTIIEISQPSTSHNGGEIFFGVDDGYLYIFTGDGGAEYSHFAQDMSSPLGKALRIDVNTGDDAVPYVIPKDNPFLDLEGALPDIFALGFRNPWRCTTDIGDEKGAGRGRIFCGDVGQSYCEEINMVVAGGNYGWDKRECGYCYPLSDPHNPDLCVDEKEITPGFEVFPISWYTEWRGGQSVTGGHVYRGSDLTDLYGSYLWSDLYIKNHTGLRSLRTDSGGSWVSSPVPLCDADTCGDGLASQHLDYAFAFGQDQDGEMYVLESTSQFSDSSDGVVYKIVSLEKKSSRSGACAKRLHSRFQLFCVMAILYGVFM